MEENDGEFKGTTAFKRQQSQISKAADNLPKPTRTVISKGMMSKHKVRKVDSL